MRYIIVITKELQDTCNALAKEHFDRVGGEYTFTVGLSENGSLPITHYWASFAPSDEIGLQIEAMAESLGDGVHIFKDRKPEEILLELGLTRYAED